MSYDTNNIFAKILRGEIPCHKVYEDEAFIAFMDVMPQAAGHTLVVPKAASRNLLDADPAVLGRMLPVVQKLAVAVKAAFARRRCEHHSVQRGSGRPERVPPARSRHSPSRWRAAETAHGRYGKAGSSRCQRGENPRRALSLSSAAARDCRA